MQRANHPPHKNVLQVTLDRKRNVQHPAKQKQITGPYSRLIDRGALGEINGSSREGRFLRAYERMLLQQFPSPSIVQRALISRTARLALHLELMDERALKEGRGFGPTDHHFYCVWANSLARHLAKLGLEQQGKKKQSFLQTLADEAAA